MDHLAGRRFGAHVPGRGRGHRTLLESEGPDDPGSFGGVACHSHEYRTPEPFEGRRVLAVGAGQSASEIAVEVSSVAAPTFMSVRSGTHVLPRWLGRRPYDVDDIDPLNRMPWAL